MLVHHRDALLSGFSEGKGMKRRLFAAGLVCGLGLLVWGTLRYGEAKAPDARRGQRQGRISEALRRLSANAHGLAAIRVPQGFEVTEAAPEGTVVYPMFITFDDRGRLFVCESAGRNIDDDEMKANPEMRIRLLEDTDGDGVFDRGRIFADKLTMAMGALWYRGALYVAAPPDVLRFDDNNGDGVADQRTVLLTGWPLRSNGTTLHGPYLGPDGWMYLTYSPMPYEVVSKEGVVFKGPGGRVWRFRPDGSGLEWIVGGGFDNGIEIVFTPAGETIGTMTYYSNPKLGLRDALLHFVEGGVYPKWRPFVAQQKRTGELMPALTKFARVAPAGLEIYRSNVFGNPYQGNLFSALFNPHRVLRHVLARDGATFRSTDEDFLVSTDPDFHPTDVAEDADGSLLVVDTGAWYLRSCPVSRIAKPEVKGAIYRVRRRGAPRVEDPRGLQLDLEKSGPAQLARLLDDPRPAVRDRALHLLSARRESAVESLVRVRETHASAEVRASAIFALARTGKAAEAVRAGLNDADFLVRVAAARMVGLNRDRRAVPRLIEMVGRDHPAARRQAATALGQIADARATPALIAAAANPDDRFVEHAIVYSLLTMRDGRAVTGALAHSSPKVRKAALIALDQMDNSPLSREHVAAGLNDSDPQLRLAALWVVSRHPDWSGEVLDLLRRQFRGPELPPEEAAAVTAALLSSCESAPTQRLIADVLSDPSAEAKRQLFLLDVVEQCEVKDFPQVWTEALRRYLRGSNTVLRARALPLVRTRQLTALDGELDRIAANPAESADMRVLALGVLLPRRERLSEAHYQFLAGLLDSRNPADLRQSAAQVLARAKLDERQLVTLAKEHVAQADPLVLPHLLEAYHSARSPVVGKAMISGLLASKYSTEGIAAERVPELLKNYHGEVRGAAKPLLARIEQQKQLRAARLKELEPLLYSGNEDRGRDIFFGSKAGCASCHTIMTEGGDVGPDLTGVGGIRSGLDLLEAIVFPSASFVPGHEVYRVETRNEVYSGLQGESTPDALVIISGPRERVRIPRKEITSIRAASVSLMPDGFADDLTRQELADLLAFLQSQTSREAAAAGGDE
jgi:putative membrane-bound dehydrogenase-like protein